MVARSRARAVSVAAWLTLVALLVVAAGCGSGDPVSDQKIVGALDLKQVDGGYAVGGDLFCVVTELLNDRGEVDGADNTAKNFVIAGPDGELGVLAQRPFAPDCTDEVERELKRLEREPK